MTEDIREYCDLKSCRRQYICEHFGFNVETSFKFDHQCCDICEKKCSCVSCLMVHEEEIFAEDLEPELDSSQNNQTGEIIEHMLETYFDEENSTLQKPHETFHTGLSSRLATEISRSYSKYNDLSCLKKSFPSISE